MLIIEVKSSKLLPVWSNIQAKREQILNNSARKKVNKVLAHARDPASLAYIYAQALHNVTAS